MYTFSKKWVNPNVREKDQRAKLNAARRKFCPKSPFWTHDFDIDEHRKEFKKLMDDEFLAKQRRQEDEERVRKELGHPDPVPIKPAFGGKVFPDNFASVTPVETVFTPNFAKREKELAKWPQKSEMKYEGDDRIATERIHGRFMGLPRTEGNETVNWAQRSVIDQYPFDDFLFPVPQAAEVIMRTHYVDELEFTDEQGELILGVEMMGLLDPVDKL